MKNLVSNPAEQINEAIVSYGRDLSLIKVILPVLKKYDGKKLSKRLENDLKKVVPAEYSVFFGKSYSWYELSVWGKDIPYGSKFNVNLGYFSKNDGKFDYEDFVMNGAQRYLLNSGRIADLKESLNGLDRKLAAVAEAKKAYDEAIAALGAAAYYAVK